MLHLYRILSIFFVMILSIHPSSANTDLLGYWRTFDDVTGSSKAIVQVTKSKTGLYSARIVEVIPIPGYSPIETCQKCPAPFMNRKILGLTILWNLQANPDADRNPQYQDGYAIDPLSGKIYQTYLTIASDDRSLRLRGHVIGASMIGRSQTWRREIGYKE